MFQLPAYTITEKIHEGSTTVVYRGRRDIDGARVAIKTLKSDPPDPAEVERLRREHALLKAIAVPGVPRVFSLEKRGGCLCLIMEDLPGQALDDLLRAQRPGLARALQIGIALAGVVGRLHLAGVVHKDIKPQNILVDPDTDEAVLVDLGVAALRSHEAPEREGVFEGTLAYMSPEQTGRMNRRVDHRADLYSLGVTLHELVTGVLPFVTTDPMELVHSHVARTPTPPHLRDPAVPQVVSDIIMRLLSKAAEERYQSAFGLRADLVACRERLRTTGLIESFALGRFDRGHELRLSQRLHGREAAQRLLLAGWERAARGTSGLLLLSGPSGVGKSALVEATRAQLARQGGYFIAGKCDQLNRSAPYAPLERAFRELLRCALTEPREVLDALAARLVQALGPNGRVVADLVPEVELVVGAQEAVPELGPTESWNRFNLVFQRFLGVFSAPQRPLTLFLDDLQWADPATLKLLGALLTDPDGPHILVIGACREGEVGDDHPLSLTLARLRASGCPVSVVPLAPLTDAEVAAFVGDTLDCAVEDAAPLAAVLREKTGGNPFFIGQLLLGLFHDGLVAFDAARGAWAWNLDVVRMTTGDDILAFVTDKLRTLAPASQRALQFAACVGHSFDPATLAGALEQPLVEVDRALAEARRAGLLVADGPDGADERGADAAGAELADHRFLHDRIQQAAYAQIGEAQRQQVHLRVGRLLRARLGAEFRDDELFKVVHHTMLAVGLLTDRDERDELVRLNLAAGRRSRAAVAFEAAADYFDAALALLDAGSWERDHAWTFGIHAEQTECAYLCGRFVAAEEACRSLLTRARSGGERLLVECRRMEMRVTQSRFAEAVDIGRAALEQLGIDVPATEAERQVALVGRLAAFEALLGDRRVDELLQLQPLSDPEIEATLHLLTILSIAGYYISPTVYGNAAVELVIQCLKHGHSSQSSVAFMLYAFILAAVHGRYERAEAFGELALALYERYPNPRAECKLQHTFGTFIHFRKPIRVALAHLERACKVGLEFGDFVFLSAAADNSVPYKFALGVPLAELRGDVVQLLALVHRTQDALSVAYLTVAARLVAALEGRTQQPLTLDGDGFAESLARDGLFPVACWFHVARLMVRVLHEDAAGALEAARAAESLTGSAAGQYFPTELSFFACLAAAAARASADAHEASRCDEVLALHGEKLALWTTYCPQNYRHKHLLVQAEVARLAGRYDEATDGFEAAIEAARAEGFVRDEAIAAERAALFHRERGRPRIARVYMAEAHAGFVRWGATTKAAMLAERHAALLPEEATASSGSITLTTRMSSAGLVDAAALVRAAQTLVGEVVLERVLERLMRLVVESAGAQRGIILLATGAQLQIAARFDGDRVEVREPLPLEQATDIAGTIVRYVARTREPIVLDDASRDPRFAADPYLTARRPRSLLCLALTQNERLTGIVYLENNAATAAFTRARVDLSALLASLAATAVENAQLYARVEEATRALRGVNESLEGEVSRRTEDLRATNLRLEVELAERTRAEQARNALHEQLVRMQEERLAELSTPILPITDRIVVMPLIGTMDAQRGRQVLEAALMGVSAHRAEVVILDVTGMKMVDAEVADMLATTAGALRLLGARALVTGVSPEVAWIFVERGGQALGTMTTVATLKAAVAQAGASGPRTPRRSRT